MTSCDFFDDICEQDLADEGGTEIADRRLAMRPPGKADAPAIHRLVSSCSPLDLNSVYTYLLLGEHFSPTCVLAHAGDSLRGFVSAYVPPRRPGVLFVWQVAVHRQARGNGLGGRMLRHLLQRPGLGHIQYIETTVGPGNMASRRMFAGLARSLRTPLVESRLFDRDLFGPHEHEDEPLLRIGPLGAR